MSPSNHHKEIVSVGSPYSKLKDPVTRDHFKTGDTIIVCDNNHGAIALSSISKIDNCPFCGGSILQQGDPVYPSIDTSYTIWETLLFALLIGGIGGWALSSISINNFALNYLIKTGIICIIMIIAIVVTKKSLGVVFAILICNLIPVFTSKVSFDVSYLTYFILSIAITWLVGVNIQPFVK